MDAKREAAGTQGRPERTGRGRPAIPFRALNLGPALRKGLTLLAWTALAAACARPAKAQAVPAESIETAGDTLDQAPAALGPPDRPAAPVSGAAEDAGERPRRGRKHPRFKSDLWLPLGSAFLPGFGQYFQGDWTGAAYTSAAVAGYAVALQGMSEVIADLGEDGLEDPGALITTQSWSYRKIVLGELAAQGSGFLSAYSAFRLSVPRFQQEDGRYLFLGRRESVGELMASPFRFGQLLQTSVCVPLGLLAGGVAYLVNDERAHHRGADWTLSGDDFLYTGAEAWNAGISEEAAFRGWIYPLAYQYMGNNFWLANGTQALLFGLAHYDPDSMPFPWPQALIGFYFGWLVKKNGWTLSESIFVHAWWDMILFAGEVATTYREGGAKAAFRVDLPLVWK